MGGWAGEKTALKTTSVWFPQITTFLVKNKMEEKDVLVAGSPGPEEKPGCPCARGTQISPRADALGVTARSQPSAPASPKCFAQGRDAPALSSLSWGGCLHPQHQVLVTHSMAVLAVSHLPPHPCSAPEDRPTPPQAEPPPWSQPSTTNQPVSPPRAPPARGCVTLSLIPKKRLLCQDCSEKEFWAGGCLLWRCH